MTVLAVEDGFDVHDYRHGLKLLEQDGETMTFANRDGFSCPACGRSFERLLVATTSDLTFDTPPNAPFCIVRTDDELLVLTH